MICYENRDGMVCAFDTDTKMFVNANETDLDCASGAAVGDYGIGGVKDYGFDADPERMRDELERRGVARVYVYTRKVPPWVSGEVIGREGRYNQFWIAACRAPNSPGSWTAVPLERIGDGSDWSDVYSATEQVSP